MNAVVVTSDERFEVRSQCSRSTRGAVWLKSVVVALLFMTGACRQIVGFEDGASTNGADAGGGAYVSSTGFWAFSDPVCGGCIDQSCTAEAKACEMDPSCKAFEGCLAACKRGDSPCAESCLTRVRAARLSPETAVLSHCQAAACSAECPSWHVTTAKGEMCGPPVGPYACQLCCCNEFAACDDDPECGREAACLRQCGFDDSSSMECFDSCMAEPVSSLDPNLSAVTDCLLGSDSRCQNECFATDDWSCLGKVQWPDPSDGWWRLYGTVLDNPSHTPLEGFRVRGCVPRDDCQQPFAETTSDSDGSVFLDLSSSPAGTTYYVEVTAPPGLNYPKHLFFEPTDMLDHSLRWDFSVYIRGTMNSVLLPDPNLGGLLFFTHDCTGRRAAGVEVTASPAGTSDAPGYVTPGLAPDPSDTATLKFGIGTITNLPPGQVTLTAVRQSTRELIGIQHVVIEAGAMTIVDLEPTPL